MAKPTGNNKLLTGINSTPLARGDERARRSAAAKVATAKRPAITPVQKKKKIADIKKRAADAFADF